MSYAKSVIFDQYNGLNPYVKSQPSGVKFWEVIDKMGIRIGKGETEWEAWEQAQTNNAWNFPEIWGPFSSREVEYFR